MQICRALAGFSYGQADLVRRAMSKKKADVMEKERVHFIDGNTTPGAECCGCVANGISRHVANEIFDDMSSFASYAFNKSHAAAYAFVAYQTAYLKCHYVHEFMAALLTSVLENTDKIIEYSAECQRLGIHVLPPDINRSDLGFAVDGQNIRFGLLALKNVGRNLIRTVIERRGAGYTSMYDFCKRLYGREMNRRAVESFIKSGSFDQFGHTRHAMLDVLEGMLKSIEGENKRNLEGQISLFGGAEDLSAAQEYQMPKTPEFTHAELLKMEKEVSGLYLSGHPLDEFREVMARTASHNIASLTGEEAQVTDDQKVVLVCTVVHTKFLTTKSASMMAFVTVEDLTGTMEVVVFPRILQQYGDAIFDNAVVVLKGRISVKEDEAAKLLADEITDVRRYAERTVPAAAVSAVTVGKEKTGKVLYLKVPSQECEQFRLMRDYLNIFSGGEIPVRIRVADTGQMIAAPRSLYVMEDELLLQGLKQLLGPDCVVLR